MLDQDSARFDAYVDRSPIHNGCHVWTAATFRGYGVFHVANRAQRAHRFAYRRAHGSIPRGLGVLHDCPGGDNPRCVNPAHLWVGTQAENMADMKAKGRARAPLGSMHGRSKLTEQLVVSMRREHARGRTSYRTFAKRHGVTWETARRAITGRTWSHVGSAS